ncbi:hypothetical protein [Sphaerisporangium corydalis]|uniref:Uncharacterized protein n=1 Tax=Sphaerisporangium corydalis TaxID=1441875 RepID=A0ABV9EE66_9ACTN|nr:hypothetical protein [Sphaerisporangium corydalis]
MRIPRLFVLSTALLGVVLVGSPASAERAVTTYSGEGDTVLRVTATAKPGIVKIRHGGEGYFSVWTLKPNGKEDDLLASTGDPYAGTVAYNTSSSNRTAALKISAEGAWSVQLLPLSKARYWAITSKGRGDDVLRLTKTSTGFHTLRIRHTGDGYFSVWTLTSSGRTHDLLVSHAGPYKGSVPLPSGTRYVTIKANGAWSMVRK